MNAAVTAASLGPGHCLPAVSLAGRTFSGFISEKLKTFTCVGVPGPGAVMMLLRPVAKSTNPEATLTPERSFA